MPQTSNRPESVLSDVGLVERWLCMLHGTVFLTGLAGVEALWLWYLIGMLVGTAFH